MGFWLHVDIDSPDHDKESLPQFVNWGSKLLLRVVHYEPSLYWIAERLGIDISPLQKISWGHFDLIFEEIDPNDKVAWAKAEQEKLQAEQEHEANWQNPTDLAVSIRALSQALDAHPNIFTEVDISTYHYKSYYLSGSFRKELNELLRIIEWAEERDFRVRLIAV